MGATAEGERDSRLGGPVRTRSTRRWRRGGPAADVRAGVVVRPRLRDEPRIPDGRRPRRFEPFPRWGYAIFAVTLVVTVAAVLLVFRDHATSDGRSCGTALFPEAPVGPPGCSDLMADAQPLTFAVGAVAVLLVMTSITTLIVRAWIPRDASTPD